MGGLWRGGCRERRPIPGSPRFRCRRSRECAKGRGGWTCQGGRNGAGRWGSSFGFGPVRCRVPALVGVRGVGRGRGPVQRGLGKRGLGKRGGGVLRWRRGGSAGPGGGVRRAVGQGGGWRDGNGLSPGRNNRVCRRRQRRCGGDRKRGGRRDRDRDGGRRRRGCVGGMSCGGAAQAGRLRDRPVGRGLRRCASRSGGFGRCGIVRRHTDAGGASTAGLPEGIGAVGGPRTPGQGRVGGAGQDCRRPGLAEGWRRPWTGCGSDRAAGRREDGIRYRRGGVRAFGNACESRGRSVPGKAAGKRRGGCRRGRCRWCDRGRGSACRQRSRWLRAGRRSDDGIRPAVRRAV